MDVMSPMSNRSESDTPVQAAPTVPSMLPVVQKPVTSQSAPMDTLSALRLHKSSRATNVPQATDCSTTTEVKALKTQLRAVELVNVKLRSDLKQLEAPIAQLIAWKSSVEQQQQAAAKRPSSEDLERRISALENAKPAIETTKFEQLHSDVQAMKTGIKKLDPLPEQLEQLRSTAAQNGKDIAEALAKSSKLETDSDGIASLKEDIKAVKEQRQAMRGDAVKTMIQTALQPEIRKMDTFRTEHANTFKKVSTTGEANQKICDNRYQRDLPVRLQSLQDRINQVESNDNKTYKKVTTVEETLIKLRKDNDYLDHDIKVYIGPIGKAYSDTKENVLQRIGYLEDNLRSLRKEQGRLSDEHDKLSTRTDKHPIDPKDFETLQSVVYSLGEDKEKLARDVRRMEGLSNEHKTLSERVRKLESAPGRSASPAPSVSHTQLKRMENLENHILDLEQGLQEQKVITSQVKNLQSGLSKTANAQKSLQDEHDMFVDQTKKFETQQTELSNEQKNFSEALESLESRMTASEKVGTQIKLLANEQAKSSNEQKKISDRVTTLETTSKPAVAPDQTVGDKHVDLSPISSEMEDIQQRFRSVEGRLGETTGLGTITDGVEDELEKMAANIHAIRSDLDVFQKESCNLFGETLDPFKASVEEQLKTHSQNFSQYSEILARLQEQVAEVQRECLEVVQGRTEVKQDLSCLREFVETEAKHRNAAVEDLKQQVVSKQDIITGTQAIDTVKAAVRNLQNQYDNISTDDLHQKMVNWFIQQYPSTTANMLQQFAVVKHEVTQLRESTDPITRIPNGAQALSELCRIVPQITRLVQCPTRSKESPETLAQANKALETINESMAKVHKQHESLTSAVGGLQTSMQKLNSNNTPFVRIESLTALEQLFSVLQADLEKEHEERVEAEKNIVLSSNDRFNKLETGAIKTTSDQVEGLQTALTKIRQDLDKMLKEFNDPVNKELFDYLPTLLLHTGQLQWVLEDLNQNLPKGGLEFEWSYDMKDKLDIPSPYPDESGEAAGKDKST